LPHPPFTNQTSYRLDITFPKETAAKTTVFATPLQPETGLTPAQTVAKLISKSVSQKRTLIVIGLWTRRKLKKDEREVRRDNDVCNNDKGHHPKINYANNYNRD
jgi:hypothetical protein